ncbi:sulfatase [Clostridium sp. chh4-2]|uniref:LTA synthase family protein n=1 Tax=Clostridium sp. chh4-2 TaxID=2067550 RepID=UPI000CCF634E|nr:alkaline phosphatase family protein [Clostridium sp. chh4-2]PNV59327.1 sulfatase [Clostridium sp. chh4-2]
MKTIAKGYAKLFLLSAVINFLIEWFSRKSIMETLYYVMGSPEVFFLNTLIIMVPFTLVWLVKHKIALMALVSIMWLGLGVINGFLLIFRTTPFTATDFRLAKYGLNMLTAYMSVPMIIAAVLGIGAAVGLCVFLWKKAPVYKKKIPYARAFVIAFGGAAVILGITKVYMCQGWVSVKFGNIGQAYQDYGFPYCFTNSIFNIGIPKPDDYSEEIVATIEQKELIPTHTYGIAENKTPNVIMIQLESFFDPMDWEKSLVKEDPIPYFRYLRTKFPSGYLKVPSVGAGTANTEFECITGMNLDFFGPGEYPYKTILKKTVCESTAFDLKELGYSTHAIHNNEGTFYDRNMVFAQLGFDTFTPIEYMYNIERNPTGWCKDRILVGEIVKALDSTPNQDFIYTISVQGHGAYPDFEYYCSQIHEMDLFIRELLLTLSIRPEPTVVVMYGDHLPGFEWDEDEMRNKTLFETPYVVWNNMNLPVEKRNVESYQLSSYVLNMVGIHEGTMIRYHQNFLSKKNMDEEKYLTDMQVLEYDMLYGDREIYDKELPYEATDLQMGIDPIVVEKIIYNKPNLLVYGKNFNQYSKVCMNGKAVDTMYVWPELIIARDLPEKKAEDDEVELTVMQIGRDKVALGEAEMLP